MENQSNEATKPLTEKPETDLPTNRPEAIPEISHNFVKSHFRGVGRLLLAKGVL